jgi:hypothetical protein
MWAAIAAIFSVLASGLGVFIKFRKNTQDAASAAATAQAYTDSNAVTKATSTATDNARTQQEQQTNENVQQTAALAAGVATAGSLSDGADSLNAAISSTNARNSAKG